MIRELLKRLKGGFCRRILNQKQVHGEHMTVEIISFNLPVSL